MLIIFRVTEIQGSKKFLKANNLCAFGRSFSNFRNCLGKIFFLAFGAAHLHGSDFYFLYHEWKIKETKIRNWPQMTRINTDVELQSFVTICVISGVHLPLLPFPSFLAGREVIQLSFLTILNHA